MINEFFKVLIGFMVVCIVTFFLFVSICYLIFYVWDIIIGTFVIVIRRLKSLVKKSREIRKLKLFMGKRIKGRWKGMKIYYLCHKIYSILEVQVEKECCRYRTPLYTFISAGIPVTLIIDNTNIFKDKYEYIGYICLSIFFLCIYFLGMFVKNYNKPEEYSAFLKHNMEFLKLSFLPCTFIITIVGFLYTVQEEKLFKQGVNISLNIWDKVSNVIISEDFKKDSLNDILINLSIYIFVFLIFLYVMSLPVQILGYFFISVILYFQKYGNGYKRLLRQNIRWLKDIVFGKSKKKDNKEVNDI